MGLRLDNWTFRPSAAALTIYNAAYMAGNSARRLGWCSRASRFEAGQSPSGLFGVFGCFRPHHSAAACCYRQDL